MTTHATAKRKTQRAIALMRAKHISATAAARHVGLNRGTVHRAIKNLPVTERPELPQQRKLAQLNAALQLMKAKHISATAAARHVGLNRGTVHRAIKSLPVTERPELPQQRKLAQLNAALRLIKTRRITAYAAARHVGLAHATVTRAIKKLPINERPEPYDQRKLKQLNAALRLIKTKGISARTAARHIGLAYTTIYKAIRRPNTPTLQPDGYQETITQACTYCGRPAHHRDHVPATSQLRKLGARYFKTRNIPLRIVTACCSCNASLGDKPLHTVAARQQYITQRRIEWQELKASK